MLFDMRSWLALALTFLCFAAPLGARTGAPPLAVSETPQGGYVLGNAQAKVRLVEYMSFTCSHCAAFSTADAPQLERDYVSKGDVAYEVRNAVRDGFDLTASLLARCGGPRRFFGNMEAIFANQQEWIGNLKKLDSAKLQKAEPTSAIKIIAQGSGLNALMQKRGFAPAQLNKCLTDKAAQDKILAMTKDAWDVRKISGTPSFFINETPVERAVTLAQLEPALKAATTNTTPSPR